MPAVPGWLSERGMGVSAQCLRFERIALDFTHRCANATARICAVPAQRQQSNLQQPPFHCYLWRAGRVGSGERNLRVAPCHRGEIRRQGAPVAPRVALRCFLVFSEGSPGPRAHKRLQPMHFRLGARVGARDSPTLTCAPLLPLRPGLSSLCFPLCSTSCLARARAHTKRCAKPLTAAQRKSKRNSADIVARMATPGTSLPTSPAQINAQEAPNGICSLPRALSHARTCVCACMHGKMDMLRPKLKLQPIG